jgi:hypothetical protein
LAICRLFFYCGVSPKIIVKYNYPTLKKTAIKTRNYLKDILFGVCVGDALGVPVDYESREHLMNRPIRNSFYKWV